MPAPRRKAGEEGEQYPAAVTPGAEPSARMQKFYLERLARLVYVKNKYDLGRMGGGWLLAAINRAIYSTLRDCIEAKAGEQAKALLRGEDQHN